MGGHTMREGHTVGRSLPTAATVRLGANRNTPPQNRDFSFLLYFDLIVFNWPKIMLNFPTNLICSALFCSPHVPGSRPGQGPYQAKFSDAVCRVPRPSTYLTN